MENNFNYIKKPNIIFLMGPTASGKTNLALNLCKYLPIEIISVDSGLIYKYMNIGTGKLNSDILLKYPHRLINILDPSQKYSALNFKKDALLEIEKILQLGKIPLLVGGTMLYYKILLQSFLSLPKSNIKIRNKIFQYVKKNSDLTLHMYLKKVDPITAYKLHPNDHYRILRALEIFFISGKKFSDFINFPKINFPYSIKQFALIPKSKVWLYNRIIQRFQNMIHMGFEREFEYLYYRGDLNCNLPSMRCIGYKQMWQYFSLNIGFTNMYKQTIVSTMQLAKKQLTWLRNWENLCLLKAHDINFSINTILNKIS